jgi:hypothetical protein
VSTILYLVRTCHRVVKECPDVAAVGCAYDSVVGIELLDDVVALRLVGGSDIALAAVCKTPFCFNLPDLDLCVPKLSWQITVADQDTETALLRIA